METTPTDRRKERLERFGTIDKKLPNDEDAAVTLGDKPRDIENHSNTTSNEKDRIDKGKTEKERDEKRTDRIERDRYRDRDYDRGYERGYDRGYDRDYDRGSRGYDRDYDREYDRDYDRGYDRDKYPKRNSFGERREGRLSSYGNRRDYDDYDNDRKRRRTDDEYRERKDHNGHSDAPKRNLRFRLSYTEEEYAKRKKKMGSELSIIDRQKFERQFEKNSKNWKDLNLSHEDETIWDDNPHIRQVFVTDRQLIRRSCITGMDRYVHENTPRTTYQRREGEFKSVDHWGQRKLLFSEIEFLYLHAMDEDVVVIYAGAAPGTHTNYLSEMFPRAYFYLVDPAEFQAKPTDRIEIVQDYFTDEMAEKLVKRFENRVILFISDIRSMNREMNDEKKEGRVAIDMEWQMKWHEILKPKVSMLKFRLPYPPQKDKEKFLEREKTNYLKGKLYFQIWCGRTSSETRLFVYGADKGLIEKVDYSHYDYENVMFHFQTVTRTSYFDHDVKGEGLDHCYDCSAEIFILSEYLKKKGYGDQLNEEVAKLSKEISRKISSSRSLLLSK